MINPFPEDQCFAPAPVILDSLFYESFLAYLTASIDFSNFFISSCVFYGISRSVLSGQQSLQIQKLLHHEKENFEGPDSNKHFLSYT